MNSEETRLPTPRHLFFVLATTFLLVIFVELLWWESQSKFKLLVLELMVVIPVLLYVYRNRFSFRNIFRWYRVDNRILLVSGFIGLGLTVLADELDRIIQSFVPIQKELVEAMGDLLTFHNTGEFLILFAATVVIASFAEEMLFRGFFQGTMERLTDVTKAVMSTALVFAVVHFNPWWFLEILIFGVLIGVIVWKSGSIFPGVAVHALKNFLAMITTNTEPDRMSWYFLKGHVHPIWLVLALGMIIGGFRLLYKFTEKESDERKSA